MSRRQILPFVAICPLFLSACVDEVDSPALEHSQVELDERALKGEQLPAEATNPRPLQIASMQVQLLGSNTAALGLQLSALEQERVRKDNNRAAFSLSFGGKNPTSVEFNDTGASPDRRAGDGVFTGKVAANIEALRAVNAEAGKIRNRTLSRFAPGGHEVIGRDDVTLFDVDAFAAGKLVKVSRLAELGPLKALDAVAAAINPQKSLIITALPVIEDPVRTMNPCANAAANNPLKVWTFGHLMDQMSQTSGFTPSAFVENWLQHWRFQQTVFDSGGVNLLDGVNNNALANIDARVINPWRARSGGGALDLRIAPFRLEAILYRPDLAISSPYGGGGGNNGGELRFVFGIMDVRDQNNDGDALDPGDTCQPIEAAVIFEYGVPLSDCLSIKNWANQWVALSALLQGTPAYATALEALTQAVVLFGAAPTKPNQNALNQLRTNEIDLTGIWQFREFVLRNGGGPLQQTTVKNNPREHQAFFTSTGATPAPINLNGTAQFLNEVLANLASIIAGTYTVPEMAAGLPYRGGASSYNFNTSWDHPALATPAELDARFKVSLNTCSGCHTAETNTVFYHVRPNGPGATPTLSNFLLNNPHNVVDVRGIAHTFNEMDNRKQALTNLANQVCRFDSGIFPFHLLRVPLLSVH